MQKTIVALITASSLLGGSSVAIEGETLGTSCAVIAGGAPETLTYGVDQADGSTLVGPFKTTDTGLQVTTLDGVIEVPADQVERTRSRKELLAELDRMAKQFGDAPHTPLELAKLARRFGLEPQMWRHLNTAINTPRSKSMQRRLDRFFDD